MAATKSRARQFAELADRQAKGKAIISAFSSLDKSNLYADFDPEAEAPENEASNSEESIDENAGTEHYVNLGYGYMQQVVLD